MVKKISKISLFVLEKLTNVTDRRTDGHRLPAYTALMHRAVKISKNAKSGEFDARSS